MSTPESTRGTVPLSPSDEKQRENEALYLSDAIGRMARAITNIGNMRLREWEFTLSSYATLRIIADRTGISMTELARLGGVRPQTTMRIVADLEARGFVEKKPNLENRRSNSLTITADGLQMVESVVGTVHQLPETLRTILGDEKVAEVHQLLRQCIRVVESEFIELESATAHY